MQHPPLRRAVSSLALPLALAACAGGANDDGATTAAIQKALDARPVMAAVQSGTLCVLPEDYRVLGSRRNPQLYTHVPGAHVVAAGQRVTPGTWPGVMEPCYRITWDASTAVRNMPVPGAGMLADANIGHYVVDKVGPGQDGPTGGKVNPYKAHFEASDLGKSLISAGVVARPADITDGQMSLHKDADGGWVAQ